MTITSFILTHGVHTLFIIANCFITEFYFLLNCYLQMLPRFDVGLHLFS